MSENKTKPTRASVDKFLKSAADKNRLQDCYKIIDIMKKITGEEPVMWGPGIVGFGKYHYRYESGREGDMCLCGFSPRKQNLVIYILMGFTKNAELMKKLGKYKTGKSCLYINKLEDIDVKVLKELIKESVKTVRKYSDKGE